MTTENLIKFARRGKQKFEKRKFAEELFKN